MRANRSKPPPVMTWPEAIPVIVAAGICDLLRAFFELFWFFGPALAAVACTAGVNSALGTSVAATAGKLVAAGCTAAAGVAGFYGAGALEMFGTIMAMAVALMGFLALGFWITMSDSRLFKVNKSGWLWLTGGLGVAEIPFIGTLPAFSVVLFILYRRQIKIEKGNFKRWQEEQVPEKLRTRLPEQHQTRFLDEEEEIPEEYQEAA